MATLGEILMAAQSGVPNVGPLNDVGLGILQDMKNVKLAKDAMSGSDSARVSMSRLAGKSPNMARTLLGFDAQDRQAEQASQEQARADKKESLGLQASISRGVLSSDDPVSYLRQIQATMAATGRPEIAEGLIDDIALAEQDLEQFLMRAQGFVDAYGNPGAANQFGATLTEAVDSQGNRVFVQPGKDGNLMIHDRIKPVDRIQQEVDKQTRLQTETPEGVAKTQQAEAAAKIKEQEIKTQNEQVEKANRIKTTALGLVQDLLKNREDTLANFGFVDSRRPGITKGPGAETAEAKIQQLEDILTSENLGIMTGVLTDRDMQVIRNIAGGGLNRKLEDSEALKNIRELERMFSSDLGIEESQPMSIDDLVNQYAD